MRTIFTVAGLAMALGACSGGSHVSYGSPTTPSGGQMSASTSLNSISTNVNTAVQGKSDGNGAFGVFDLMASLQGTATNNASSQGLSLSPSDLPASCTSGSALTGFTYTACPVGSNTTLDGSIKITTTSVTYDLDVHSGAGGATTHITLKGTVSSTGTMLTGDLEYKIHIDLGSLGGLAGGAGQADTTVTANWNITTSECGVSAGTITVEVDNANGTHGAQFEYTACNMFTVRNG